MYLSSDIPHFEVLVRKEFLYNQESGHGEFESGVCFAVSSITNRALGFHVMLDNGAIFWRLPLNALVCDESAPVRQVGEAQFWDNISYNITVNKFNYIKDRACNFKIRTGIQLRGTYMFTIDYAESEYAESANEHKCSHIIRGDDGNFYSMPNNRVLWEDSSRITPKIPDYKVNTHIYYAEDDRLTATDKYFYEMENND